MWSSSNNANALSTSSFVSFSACHRPAAGPTTRPSEAQTHELVSRSCTNHGMKRGFRGGGEAKQSVGRWVRGQASRWAGGGFGRGQGVWRECAARARHHLLRHHLLELLVFDLPCRPGRQVRHWGMGLDGEWGEGSRCRGHRGLEATCRLPSMTQPRILVHTAREPACTRNATAEHATKPSRATPPPA